MSSDDFDRVWDASDRVARDFLFEPAVEDRRAGLYRTEPMVSAQWFEPWRREVRTIDDRAQSSLASIRRTLSVTIKKTADGTFTATPSVLVERFALSERRITNAASYRSIYGERRRGTYGSAEADAGLALPDSYWYAIGNDPVLEQYVARVLSAKLAER